MYTVCVRHKPLLQREMQTLRKTALAKVPTTKLTEAQKL